jgi:hypothetical protein
VGWSTIQSPILPRYGTPVTGNPGGQAVLLGIVDQANQFGISAIQQQIALPAAADAIQLSFRYYPIHDTTPTAGDFQSVDLYDAETGQLLQRLMGVQLNDRMWHDQSFDLSPLAGRTVQVLFVVTNDGPMGTAAMYVDDVSAVACSRPELMEPRLVDAGQPAQGAASASLPRGPMAVRVIPAEPTLTPDPEMAAAGVVGEWSDLGGVGMMLSLLGILGAAGLLIPYLRRNL